MKRKLIPFIILPLLFCSGCSLIDNSEPIENKQFVDATLDSKTFAYDGHFHSLEVTGVPEGTSIVYTNNNQTDVGTYAVVAELSKEGYYDKTLSATLTITANTFADVSFLSKKFAYDGEPHSLEVTGAPEGTNIVYKNNNQTDIGTYTVIAELSKEGYYDKTLSATLTITANSFTDVSFLSKTFDYDEKAHSLEVTGAPEGTSIVYTNNNQTDIGTYTVTAKLSKIGYESKTLTATLTIRGLAFNEAKLESKTFDYDGEPHSLEVTGAPEGTTIVYANNSQSDVGTYTVTAKLSKIGYESKTLTATLMIKGLAFNEAKLESKTFDYDGEPHSLEVTGVPEGTSIVYSNNNKTNVGTYTVTAKLSKIGYESKTLTAILTIKGLAFNAAKLESKTFAYDGKPHSLEVTGVPEGTSIVYSNNNKTNVGTYTVTAKLSKIGYENKTLTATLTISDEKVFPDPDREFKDLYFIYDNKDIAINEFFSNYEYNLSNVKNINYSVIYKVNGKTKTEPMIKNVGEYNISAIYSATGYTTKTISFKITISDQIGGVDQTKTPYQFTKDSKFKDLFNEIKKANYSVKRRYFDEYDYDKDGTFETIKDSPNESNYFVTPEAFAGRHNENSTLYSTKDYFISKGTNYAFNYYFEEYSLSRLKFPVSNYLENVIYISGGMLPFTLLKESDDGGFENSSIGGYHDSYGSFVIDTENNALIITSRCYYLHNEFNHNEVNEYIFYNIGNTTVSLPDEMKGDDSKQNLFTTDNFVENGVTYKLYETNDGEIAFCADVTLNECDDAYLGGGVYTLRAEIEGVPVSQIDYDYYYSRYYVDHSIYQINVYYDNDGYYQGKYAALGFVKYYLDARKYGNINYYGEWDV